MRPLSNQHKGIFCIAFSAMLFGFLGYFGITIINKNNFSIFNMLFWCFFISDLTLLFLMLIILKKPQFPDFNKIAYAFLCGALFYSASASLYFYASIYIGIGLSIIIFFSYPVLVSLLNLIFYGYKIKTNYYISFLIILTGLFLLIDKNNIDFNIYGIIFPCISALSYAFYIVFCKEKAHNVDPLLSALTVSIGATFTFFFMAKLHGSFYIPFNYNVWLNILAISLICTAFPIILMMIGLQLISSTKASIISVLEPIFTIIIGVIFLDEIMRELQIVGIFIILTGTLISQINLKKIKASTHD